MNLAQSWSNRNVDLLRLIAQKESKCFELRSQLEMHEAELAERACSVIPSRPNAYLFSPLSSRSVIIKVKRKWQKIVNKGLEYRPCSVASSADTSTIVFNGIKEGVQRVSRLLLARFLYTLPPSSYPTISTQSGQCFLLSLNKYHNAAVVQTILI